MKRLPLEALKFQATLEYKGDPDTGQYLHLRLRYYVQQKAEGKETTLVVINLRDTVRYDPVGGPVFWFHFTPVSRIPGEDGKSVVGMYAQIDIVVYSSIDVIVSRNIKNLDKWQVIGVEGASEKSMLRDNLFSPIRPRIVLRRVHGKAQIPQLGSASNLAMINADFSFYVDERGDAQYTTTRTLYDLQRKDRKRNSYAQQPVSNPATESGNSLIPRHTWTQVFTDAEYTEFNFLESSYSLRVYDQYYDEVNGNHVVHNDIATQQEFSKELSLSHDEIHRAELLRSRPKYFEFAFLFDKTAHLASDGYQLPYRTRLDIWKSDNVLLTGTILRNSRFDRMTQQFINEANPRPGIPTRALNFRDFLPWIHLIEARTKREIPLANLLQSQDGKAAYEFQKSSHQKFMEFQFSLLIGFTPILGEAFGLYELYTALRHDEDAFGNKLTDTEKVIVAVAAVLPLVGSGALREGVSRLSRTEFPLLSELQQSMAKELANLSAIYRQ